MAKVRRNLGRSTLDKRRYFLFLLAEEVLAFGSVELVEHFPGEVSRGTVVDDVALLERNGARAVFDGVVDLVQSDHHRDAVRAVQSLQGRHDNARGLGVQGGNGLVCQKHLGPLHERPGDGSSLLLAAGQGGGTLPGLVDNAHTLESLEGQLLILWGKAAGKAFQEGGAAEGPETDVAGNAQASNKIELLEDDANVGAHLADVAADAAVFLDAVAVHKDLPTVPVASGEAADVAHEGGLAGTRRAYEGNHLALFDMQIDVGQGPDIGKALVQVGNMYHWNSSGMYKPCRK